MEDESKLRSGSEESKHRAGSAVLVEEAAIALSELPSQQPRHNSCGSDRGGAVQNTRSDANTSRGGSVVSTGGGVMPTSAGGVALGTLSRGSCPANNGFAGNGVTAAPPMRVMHAEPSTSLVTRWTSQREGSSGNLPAQTQQEVSELVESIHVEEGDEASVRDELVEKFTQLLQEKGKQQQQMLQEAEAKLWALEQRNHDLVVENYQLRTKASPATVPGPREPVLAIPGRSVTPAVQAAQMMQPIAMTPRGPLVTTVAVAPTPPVAAAAAAASRIRVRSGSPGPRPAWANAVVSGPVAPQPGQLHLMEPVTAQASPPAACRAFMTGTALSAASGSLASAAHPPVLISGRPAQTPTIDAAFDSIDTNHDGVISRSEWARAGSSGAMPAWRAPTPTPCRDQLFLQSSCGAVTGSPQKGVGRSISLMPGSPGQVAVAAGSLSVPPGPQVAAGSLSVPPARLQSGAPVPCPTSYGMQAAP